VGVLWGVLWLVPELRSQQLVLGRLPLPGGGSVEPALGVASMVLAWSVTEIIRYAFYFCKECGYVPAPLLWARYSGFLLLYPTGVASELAVVYLALPSLKARGFYRLPMPNAINLAFDATDLFRLALLGYVFGFPMLFGAPLPVAAPAAQPHTSAQATCYSRGGANWGAGRPQLGPRRRTHEAPV